jgi:hypothetical protein
VTTQHPPLRIEPQPDQNLAAERFDDAHPLPRSWFDRDRERPWRQLVEDSTNELQAFANLLDTDPHPGVDVASSADRDRRAKRVVGRVGEIPPGIEISTRGATDMAAGGEAPCEAGSENPGRRGAVLQGRRIVVDLHEPLEAVPDRPEKLAQPVRAGGIEIDHDPARDDPVHHQPMAEEFTRELEKLLA